MIKKLLSIFNESADTFEGQESGEVVILLLRQHYFSIIYPIFFIFLLAFVPMVVLVTFGEQLAEHGLITLVLFISCVWYLFEWLILFYCLLFYTMNVVMITNRRIIESEQLGLFDRKISELHTYRVQDISVHTEGLMETFLDFGDMTVQTAASEKQFVFRRIPNPEKVKDTIMEIVGKHQEKLGLQ